MTTDEERDALVAQNVRLVERNAAMLEALKEIALGTTFGNETKPPRVLNAIARAAIAISTSEAK